MVQHSVRHAAEDHARDSIAGMGAHHQQFGAADRKALRDRAEDAKIAAIVGTGANLAEIDQALVWASGDSDIGNNVAHPPMPNLGLARRDIEDLIDYIETLNGE